MRFKCISNWSCSHAYYVLVLDFGKLSWYSSKLIHLFIFYWQRRWWSTCSNGEIKNQRCNTESKNEELLAGNSILAAKCMGAVILFFRLRLYPFGAIISFSWLPWLVWSTFLRRLLGVVIEVARPTCPFYEPRLWHTSSVHVLYIHAPLSTKSPTLILFVQTSCLPVPFWMAHHVVALVIKSLYRCRLWRRFFVVGSIKG